ncbi:predicted protein [Lichtheimia corymbifera JMRC:FSU:9682]|uniref:Uncharacterized protein n=1 Tax=Lichtheimia corymbifera JMRC:FSU:9682 TaxID=1263082 RepID=A0A068RHM7_9FUNG|nr:predicted protein [Lichtheimia corymbifera JMRC:FSU:9682]
MMMGIASSMARGPEGCMDVLYFTTTRHQHPFKLHHAIANEQRQKHTDIAVAKHHISQYIALRSPLHIAGALKERHFAP